VIDNKGHSPKYKWEPVRSVKRLNRLLQNRAIEWDIYAGLDFS